ncbi:hypothetical protein [Noviherbaspirillum soli]|uniref:hypothetical protein n=1 Tax=Noviherbaspirillum soli TaxID=1064518 RepID=UPI00188BC433|nr:hypothetical protein [Noviherbaspirillum soli]
MVLDSAEKHPAYVKPAQPVMRLRMAGRRNRMPACASGQSWLLGGSADQACDSTVCCAPGCAGDPPAAAWKKRLTPSSAGGCDNTGAAWLAGMEDGGSPTPDESAARGLDEA